MTDEMKDYILRALANNSGDDLERFQNQAGRLSDEERSAEWGCSGKSFNDHLQACQKERDMCIAARNFIQSL